MGNRGFDDEEPFTESDERFDESLRSEFARAFPRQSESVGLLDELAPTMVRAKRVHQAKQVMLGAAASILLIGGLGLAVSQVRLPTDERSTVAGQPEDEQAPNDGEPLEVTGTTSGQAAVPISPTTTESEMVDGVFGGDEAATTIPEPSDGSPASPTTYGQPSTTRRPTSTSGSGSPPTTLVESSCGSLIVSVSGSTIRLVESNPLRGYSVDEKSSGPTKIEVGFEGRRGHCELTITMRDGRLSIEREN